MFFFFSPTSFTGGPLAIHQAAQRMNALGGNASIVYCSPREIFPGSDSLQVSDGILKVQNFRPSKLAFRAERRRKRFYNSIDKRLLDLNLPHACEASIGDHFIVPEGSPQLAETLMQLGCQNVYFWWLSVDNFPLSNLHHLSTLRTLRNCENLCQSAYARDFVSRLGATHVSMLSDFTDYHLSDAWLRTWDQRSYDIAYLASKAQGAGPILTELRQKFDVIALENMSPDEIKKTLCDSRMFLDFGHHPGKDRVPREATICGAVPLVRKAGAAAFYEDVPLPPELLIDTEDFFHPTKIVGRVSQTLENAGTFQPDLSKYRQTIMEERDIFDAELIALIARTNGTPLVR